jgi:hypothetical protein
MRMIRSSLRLTIASLCVAVAPPLLAIDIQFDFTYDSSNFFNGNLQRQNVLNAAAQVFESRLTDTLTAITPSAGNTWTASFSNPSTGTQQLVVDRAIGTNVVVVYAGARDLSDGTLGLGGPGGFSVSGTQAFVDAVAYRGQTGAAGNPPTDFGPWGGSISFDSLTSWYFDQDVTTMETITGMSDFYSVAVHELAHLLGFGTAPSWNTWVVGSNFIGPASMSLHSGLPVPLDAGLAHWADGTTSNVTWPVVIGSQEAAMDPSLLEGTRKYFTSLDYGGLDDVGWTVIPEPATATLLLAGLTVMIRRRRPVTA